MMTKIKILLLLFFTPFLAYSQFNLMDNKTDEKTFQLLHRPSKTNKLSGLLQRHISQKELAQIDKYDVAPNLYNSIRARFEVNNNGKPWNFRVYLSTDNKELNKKVQQLLKNFLITEIPNLKDLKYSLNYIQLFSKENNKTIINASSVIVSDYTPIFNNCKNKRYSRSYDCFKADLENFIIKNINYEILKNVGIIGELRFHVNFKIDKSGKLGDLKVHSYSPNTIKNGKIFDFKISSYSEKIEQEIKRLVQIYGAKILGSATRNGIPFDSFAGRSIRLFISENLNATEILNLEKNDFTKVFRKELNPNTIESTELYPASPVIKLFINYNNKGSLNQIWTNTINKTLNKNIIKVFKNKINDTLSISKDYDRIYTLSIIREVNKNKIVVCDNSFDWSSPGTFKECSDCNSYSNLQKHNIKLIENYIINEFNSLNGLYSLSRKADYTLKGEGPYNTYNNSTNDYNITRLKIKHGKQGNLADDLSIKIGVDQNGVIFKLFGPSIRDFYFQKTEKEVIDNPSFKKIRKDIDLIIEKLPNFIKPPLKNGKPTSIELGNLSFHLKTN